MTIKLQSTIKKYFFNFLYILRLARDPKNFIEFCNNFYLLTTEPSIFSSQFYAKQYKDVDQAKISPLLHYVVKGWKEGRDPSPGFKTNFYLETNKDIQRNGFNPLLHFISKGWYERRSPSPMFLCSWYDSILSPTQSTKTHPLLQVTRISQYLVETELPLTPFYVNQENYNLNRPLTVVIPVYISNIVASNVFKLLINSISFAYPRPTHNLSFCIIDDSSPLKQCETILRDSGFLQRNDTTYLKNGTNKGFVETINRGIHETNTSSDILILNSDTELFGKTFEILQNTCYRMPKTASVTPLSNKATIASLQNWPLGVDGIYSLTPKETSQIIEEARLTSPSVAVPTGHGFCMYMSREAIQDIGVFDTVTFGQGYGEENDWSLRATGGGYHHLICTECFVFHHESKSFCATKKLQLQHENSIKLEKKHPYYDRMVHRYLKNDLLQNHRNFLQILLSAKQKRKHNLKTLCFVIHDSFKTPTGGIQQHVRQLIDTLLSNTNLFELFVISPTTLYGEQHEIHFFQGKEYIQIGNLESLSLTEVLKKLNHRIDFLHIHHTLIANQILLDWISDVKVIKKIVTIHDYDMFCTNPYLLNDRGVFCFADQNKKNCATFTCENKQSRNLNLLKNADIIYVPSYNCKQYVNQLVDNEAIARKIHILPHFLPFADKIAPDLSYFDIKNNQITKIIFLGSLFPHKGGAIFLKNSQSLQDKGFITSVWGHAEKDLLSKYSLIPPILPYRNWRELLELHRTYGAHIIVIPSICAETFSYTLYEALFLLEVPIVVGEFGHPAEVVTRHNLGEVLHSNHPDSLLKSINKIANNYGTYINNVKRFKEEYLRTFTAQSYSRKYTHNLDMKCSDMGKDERPYNQLPHYSLSGTSKSIMNKALHISPIDGLRILFVHFLTESDPPFFFRVENPIAYSNQKRLHSEVCHLDNIPVSSENYDLIYLSRTPMTSKLSVLIEDAKKKSIPCILDIDDLIFHTDFLKHLYFLDENSPEYLQYFNLVESIEKTFISVDILLGSTPTIAVMGERYGKTSIYFRNMLRQNYAELYQNLYANRPIFKSQLIGYFSGSNTHDQDFEVIIPVLEEIFLRLPEAKLLVMGFMEHNDFFSKHSDRIEIQPFDSYEKYLEVLRCCKVIVTPIAEINDFSHAKSGIKFLEAASVGTPVISSPIAEMVYHIEHGTTGWIANDHNGWLECLEIALTGISSEKIGETAYTYAMANMNNNADTFHQLISALSSQTTTN